MNTELFMCARFQAKPEHKDELRARLIEMVRLSHAGEALLAFIEKRPPGWHGR